MDMEWYGKPLKSHGFFLWHDPEMWWIIHINVNLPEGNMSLAVSHAWWNQRVLPAHHRQWLEIYPGPRASASRRFRKPLLLHLWGWGCGPTGMIKSVKICGFQKPVATCWRKVALSSPTGLGTWTPRDPAAGHESDMKCSESGYTLKWGISRYFRKFYPLGVAGHCPNFRPVSTQ